MSSKYFLELRVSYPDVAKRYEEKIRLINNVDPYLLKKDEFLNSEESFPTVSGIDIVSYLVLTHSYYTKEQMKAFKSLNAFKYFEAGFVEICGAKRVGEFVVVVGKVKHSQRLNNPPLNAWVICEPNGSVQSAHCTCLAGTSEVCSHIGALLYALEDVQMKISSGPSVSCTDVSSVWNVPKLKKVPMLRLRDIISQTKSKPSTSFADDIQPLSEEEQIQWFQQIQESEDSCAVMPPVEPFASELATNVKEEVGTFSNLYKKEFELLSLSQLQEVTPSLTFELTMDDCSKIFGNTLKQADCSEWHVHRIGRVTASKFGRVCKTKINKPSLSLIKIICYPLKYKFSSKYTDWGIKNESKALREYEITMQREHENFTLNRSGLIVVPEFPEFAASPDGLTLCSCCGNGCVEVKCPWNPKMSYMEDFGDTQRLKRDHIYFFQVQMQMKLAKTLFSDFVVWTKDRLFIERIEYNDEFWNDKSQQAQNFHKAVILPELLGKGYTRSSGAIQSWCLCGKEEDGSPMIECANADCNVIWYHFNCVDLEMVPDYPWMCNACAQ